MAAMKFTFLWECRILLESNLLCAKAYESQKAISVFGLLVFLLKHLISLGSNNKS